MHTDTVTATNRINQQRRALIVHNSMHIKLGPWKVLELAITYIHRYVDVFLTCNQLILCGTVTK